MRNNQQVDKNKPESEWTFKTVVLGPNGPQETEMRIFDLLAEATPLETLAQHCTSCPANIRSTDFGCGGAIHYPITAQAERWLVSRLPADLNSVRGHLLTSAIADFSFSGSDIDAARSRKEIYESTVPAIRKWGGFFPRRRRSAQVKYCRCLLPLATSSPHTPSSSPIFSVT